MDWEAALNAFLDSRRSENTRRAYERTLRELERHAGRSLGEIRKPQVAAWVGSMRAAGLAESSIAQKLAAASSFYDYAADVFDSGESNPAGGRSLRGERVQAYANAAWLDSEQCQALLGAIDRSTAIGRRDYALFLGYLMMGWRNSEWRTVTLADLAGERMRWRGKGQKTGRVAIPDQVRQAVEIWLRDLRPGSEFVFPGLSGRCLSAEQVRNRLRVYLRQAGLEGRGIHVHSLRHSAVMLRKSAGETDILKLRDFLRHSNVNTTQIYLHQLELAQDSGWMKVGELLGLK